MASLFIVLQIIILDVITLRGVRKIFPRFSARHRKYIRNAIIILATVSVLIILVGHIFQRRIFDYRLFAFYYYLFGLVATIYIPKFLFTLFLFADWMISAIRIRPVKVHHSRHIVAKGGFWVSLGSVCFIVWGILFGRFNFSVEHVDVTIDNLPPSFHGYKIVQISDVHAGSFAGHTYRFQKAVDLINRQEPNLIVFTGDMVNNFADEATSLIPLFSQLDACDGKFAVLGNHDYGGYHDWKTPSDSAANHKALENAIEQMGFVLLNNQSAVIDLSDHTILPSSDRIALIGIENWGIQKRYPKRSDPDQAMEPVRDIPFKILLSHNPAFWPEYVVGKTDIALTLSGHTHGMQMGVRLGKKYYGPAIFFRRSYRYWAGLYRTGNQYLYVNRGLGVIGFPGRIGMSPEITVITLR